MLWCFSGWRSRLENSRVQTIWESIHSKTNNRLVYTVVTWSQLYAWKVQSFALIQEHLTHEGSA